MTANDKTKLRNEAISSGRLMGAWVKEPAVERCHQCGELLHPYPKPESWMQYPLPECCILDGFKMCDTFRKPECVDAYLASNPAPAAAKPKHLTRPSTVTKSRAGTGHITVPSNKRDAAAASVAATLPADRAALLDAAKECIELYNDAVLNRADFAALVISERYDAVVWKLNGGTYFGCNAGDESAGSVVARHCQAAPGEVPLWGQRGEFIVTIKEIRCWVKYAGGLGSMLSCHFEFNALDLDGPFISETGYRSHFCAPMRGKTVDAAATEIFGEFLTKQRRYLDPDYQDRKAQDELPQWIQNLPQPARRRPALREPETLPVPDGFVLVDVVLTSRQAFIARKWAEAARVKIIAASRQSRTTATATPAPEASLDHQADEGSTGDDNADPDPDAPQPGQRWRIVSVHHPCFNKDIGKIIVITKTNPAMRSVFAHDDQPVTYRKNRKGRMVVAHNPRCIETIYGWDSLEPV